MANNRISIQISAENAELISKVTQSISSLKGLSAAGDQVSNSFMGMSGHASTWLGKYAQMGMVIMGARDAFFMLKAAIDSTVGSFIKYDAELEQSKIAFTTMLGSADAADVFIKQLQKFAADTPYEFPQLQMAAKKMMAFGFAARDVIPDLTAIGNAAAALGLSGEGVDRIVLALGQMQIKARLSGEEIRQLNEAGIGAQKYLADAFKLTGAQFQNLADTGITGAQAVKAILDGMANDPKFKDMMEAQSKTAIGMLSTLKDNVRIIGGQMVQGLFENTKDMLKSITDFTNSAVAAIKTGNLSEAFKNIIPPEWAGLINTAWEATKKLFANIKKNAKQCYDLFAPVGAEIGKAFLIAWPYVVQVATDIGAIGRSIAPVVKVGLDLIVAALKLMEGNAKNVVVALTGMLIINTIWPMVKKLEVAFLAVRAAVKLLTLESMKQFFTTTLAGIASAIKGVKSLRDVFNLLGVALKKLNSKNIILFITGLALTMFGDRLMSWIESYFGTQDTGTSAEDDAAARAAQQAEEERRRYEKGLEDLQNNNGTPLDMEAGVTRKQYEQAKSLIESEIATLEAVVKAKQAELQTSIDEINNQAAQENRSLTLEEERKIIEMQLQMAQNEYGMLNQEKSLRASLLNSADAQGVNEVNKSMSELDEKMVPINDKIQKMAMALNAADAALGKTTPDVKRFMRAISGQESGGEADPTHAENDRTGAYGAFQIMPDNWPSWVQEAIDHGIEVTTEQSMENQNKVAQYMMQKYFNEFQNWRDVAIAWYAGPDAVRYRSEYNYDKRYGEIDPATGRGKEPSINEYADSVMARMDSLPATTEQAGVSLTALKNMKVFEENFTKLVQLAKELSDKEREIDDELNKVSGHTAPADKDEIAKRYEPYLDAFKANGLTAQFEKTQTLVLKLQAKVDLEQANKDLANYKTDLQDALQKADQKYLLNPADQRRDDARRMAQSQALDTYNRVTKTALEAAQKAAEITGNPDDLRAVQQAQNEYLTNVRDTLMRELTDEQNRLQAEIETIQATSLPDIVKEDLIKTAKQNSTPTQIDLIRQAMEAARKLGDVSTMQQLQTVINNLERVKTLTEQIGDTANQALANGLSQFFLDIVNGAKSAKEAFRDLALAVLQAIQQMLAQMMAAQIMKSIFGSIPGAATGGAVKGGTVKAATGGLIFDGRLKKFSVGGGVWGAGTATSDSIPAMLSNGEWVIKAASVKKYGHGFLAALNDGRIKIPDLPRFATGGLVNNIGGANDLATSLDVKASGQPITIANFVDGNMFRNFMQSSAGTKTLINVLQANKNSIKRVIL